MQLSRAVDCRSGGEMALLQDALRQFEKAHGAGKVFHGTKDIKPLAMNLVDFPRLPTFILPVDYSIAGGIPLNQPVELQGPQNGGKTSLATMLAKALPKFCMNPACLKPLALCKCKQPRLQKTVLIHLEGLPPEKSYYDMLSYDSDKNLVIILPEWGEQACDMIEGALTADDCGLVIVDSIAGLSPRAEQEKDYESALVASQPRLVSVLMRRLSPRLVKEFRRGHMVGVVLINQIRSVIGGGTYGPTENNPGGFALKHYCRLNARISQLTSDDLDSETNVKNILRFSMSLLGSNAKQQLLLLSGKAEYRICVRHHKGYTPGTSIDGPFWTQKAKELGMLEQIDMPGAKGWRVTGTKLFFNTLSEIDSVFQTGSFKGRHGVDDALKFLLVKAARDRHIKAIEDSSKRRVIVCQPGGDCDL
jgi:recombination protein RecA